jgi:hypothetical protein
MRMLREDGPAKLQPAEQERIRDAADALFFAEEIAVDEIARSAVSDMAALAQVLAESGRWSDERARELLSDVLGCGPVSPVS